MASSIRQKRVAERLKQEIGKILLVDLKDPRIGIVSVTRVKISSDLRSAGVYVSVLGDDSVKKRAMQALVHARGYIQTQVARRVELRFAPIIRFHLDESIERSIRVSKILDDLARERGEDPHAEEEEGDEEESPDDDGKPDGGDAPGDGAGEGE